VIRLGFDTGCEDTMNAWRLPSLKSWSKHLICRAVWFDPYQKNYCSQRENCHAAEKSEAIAMCKEMPVIPVNKMVAKKKTNWERLRWRKGNRGRWRPPPPKKKIFWQHKGLKTKGPKWYSLPRFLKQNSIPELAKSEQSWVVWLLKHFLHCELAHGEVCEWLKI
jgi:hypothetical protein